MGTYFIINQLSKTGENVGENVGRKRDRLNFRCGLVPPPASRATRGIEFSR